MYHFFKNWKEGRAEVLRKCRHRWNWIYLKLLHSPSAKQVCLSETCEKQA
jgi:hypothetical protein